MKYEIRVVREESSKEYDLILEALRKYNRQHVQKDNQALTIAIFDQNGILAAGLNGATHYGWLHVEHLWVGESHRKQGLGKQLLDQAEADARSRGCDHVYLDTFSFQAPHFYKKQGYVEYARFDQFPGEHSKFFFKKKLVGTETLSKVSLSGLDSVLIFVNDVEQSKNWYEQVLNTPPTIDILNFVEFRVGRSALGIHLADKKSPLSTGGQVAYWAVDHFDSLVSHLISHGGQLYRGPLEIEAGRSMCQILDPFGNVIGLIG